jgi:hypothetical protein
MVSHSINTRHMIILHQLDKWWFITVGPIILILLLIILTTFRIAGSLTQPVDIILAMVMF